MKRCLKRLSAFLLMVATLVTLQACGKTCTCTRFDGSQYEYTSDEVAASGSSCDNMRFQAGMRYYSRCQW